MQVALVTLALKNEGTIVPGYTHLQRAQPILLEHLLLAYVEQVHFDSKFIIFGIKTLALSKNLIN